LIQIKREQHHKLLPVCCFYTTLSIIILKLSF